MFLKPLLPVVAVVVALFVGSCTDDKKKEATEPVAPSASEESETPAAPSGDSVADLQSTPIYFGFDDYTLNSDAQSTLTALAEGLKANKNAVVQIEGHCDERGTVEYNLALGERRAQSVKNFLSQLGVESSRLSTISYGEEKPVSSGHSEDDWVKNRRAEFVITGNNY
jgi:peptidoglycan-associated lipoprotein